MSGHTPGPWRVDHETTGGDICTIHSLPRSFMNGQGWAYIYGENRYPDDAEQVANARLIAAAPVLLAACRAAEARIVSLYSGIGPSANRADGSNGHAESDEVVAEIRAAIAAAEPKP